MSLRRYPYKGEGGPKAILKISQIEGSETLIGVFSAIYGTLIFLFEESCSYSKM